MIFISIDFMIFRGFGWILIEIFYFDLFFFLRLKVVQLIGNY